MEITKAFRELSCLRAVDRVGGLDRARARADEFAEAARTALSICPTRNIAMPSIDPYLCARAGEMRAI